MDDATRLLADIGGTYARLAWQPAPGAPWTDERTLRCDDHDGVHAVIEHYLRQRGGERPTACGIGIATPVTGDRVRMTNRDWSFSQSELRHRLDVRLLRVLNDFEALALALTQLDPQEVRQVGGDDGVPEAARAVIGPGTGLGVATLVPTATGPVALAGEGGHITLAANDDEDAAVLQHLRRRFGHVSAERVLSGPGLVNLHDVARERLGLTSTTLTPAQVVSGAHALPAAANPDAAAAACTQALDWFFGFLGSVAGNLALTVGARGGVYIGGGIVPRMVDRLRQSRFRQRFEAKGRYRGYLAAIPTWVIDTQAPVALRGVARALDQAASHTGE